MACAAIYHLVELAHENNGLNGARTMLGVENDRCLLFEDHVKGEVMAEDSTRNNPISVESEPLRDYAPQAGVQPNNCLLYTSPSPRD